MIAMSVALLMGRPRDVRGECSVREIAIGRTLALVARPLAGMEEAD